MKTLSRQDLVDLLHGAAILGTGGGGELDEGLALIDQALAAGKTFWRLGDIELPEGGLSFLKVGDGSNIRSYASCCGTLFNTAGGAQFPIGGRPLTRNNVKHADGSPYCPPASECHDGLTKFAFDDYELPDGNVVMTPSTLDYEEME